VAYMSPEHFTTRLLSEKSDIFSFGVIMYELLRRLWKSHPIHGTMAL